MARDAAVSARMVISMRRISGCSAIGLMPLPLAPGARPCRRSSA